MKKVQKGKGRRFKSSLMGKNDLKRLLSALVDHFATTEQGNLEHCLGEDCPAFDEERVEDIGVTAYKNASFAELSLCLSFEEGHPVQFSKYQSQDNKYDAWDDHSKRRWENGGMGMIPILGQWHQLAGVSAIMDKIFIDTTAPPKTSHILIADDVGLRKMLKIMMILAFLIQVYVCEANEGIHKRPPSVSRGEYRKNLVSFSHHLYVMIRQPFFIHGPRRSPKPPTSAHFAKRCNSSVEPGVPHLQMLEIHIVNGNESKVDAFFASPAWQQSKTPMIFRVVLMQHSVPFHFYS